MGFTLEQFKEWVNETFPNNQAREIAENDFRDGLGKMADFVFDTNSTAFIQDSINQITLIKDNAHSAAETAEDFRDSTNVILNQAQLVKAAMDLIKSQVDSQLLVVQQLIAQGFNVKGNWDIPGNSPNLAAVSKVNGDAYIVLVSGTTSITGTAISAVKGDAFHWNALDSKWIYRPNAILPADGSVNPIKTSFMLIGKNKFTESLIIPSYTIDNSGAIVAASSGYSIYRTDALPSTDYVFSGVMGNPNLVKIRFEDASGNLISIYNANSANFSILPATFTTPANCAKIVLNTRNGGTVVYASLQLEIGKVPTPYEAYKYVIDDKNNKLLTNFQKTEVDTILGSFVPGKNLLDKNKIIEYISVNNSGALQSTANSSVSRVSVSPLTQYTFSGTKENPSYTKIRFEREDGTLISVYNANASSFTTLPVTFITPANCVRMVINTKDLGTSDYNTLQLELGAVASTYEAYKPTLNDPTWIKTSQTSRNLLNKAFIIEGQVVHNSGSIVSSPVSSMILMNVTPSTTYTYSGIMENPGYVKMRFEKADGTFISVFNANSANFSALPVTFATPAECTRMYISTKTNAISNYDTLQLQLGSVYDGYVPFGSVAPATNMDLSGYLRGVEMLPWLGKQVIFFGDSITNYGWFQPYVKFIHKFMYRNNAVSGSCIATGKETAEGDGVTRVALVTRVTTAAGSIPSVNSMAGDLIFVFAGTNDWHYGVPIGTISDTVTTTFYGAVKALITSLQAGNVGKTIVMCTPIQRGILRTNYEAQKQYADVIKEVSAMYGVPVLDFFHTSGITYENIGQFTDDNVHPSRYVGVPMIARKIINFLYQV